MLVSLRYIIFFVLICVIDVGMMVIFMFVVISESVERFLCVFWIICGEKFVVW